MYPPIYLCVCMSACLFACMYACIYVCMYACMYVCMYACIYECLTACMHVCMYACMHVCMCIHVYIHMHVCILIASSVWDPQRVLCRGRLSASHLGLGATLLWVRSGVAVTGTWRPKTQNEFSCRIVLRQLVACCLSGGMLSQHRLLRFLCGPLCWFVVAACQHHHRRLHRCLYLCIWISSPPFVHKP